MNLRTIKFNKIPNDISILKLFNKLNRQFHIQVQEYKGIGFIKREEADEQHYNLIVEFRKFYLMKKVLDIKMLESKGYKLMIEDIAVFYRVVGMKYLVCEMRDGSISKDRTLKFKTLESQNVLDVVAKVVGKARFEIEYLISNKSYSYIAMKKNVDAKQLLILLKNQNYEADWSDIYHQYEYFSTESQYMPKNLPPSNSILSSHSRRYIPYKRQPRNTEQQEESSKQSLKNLETQLKETNKQLNALMNDRLQSQSGNRSTNINNSELPQQPLIPAIQPLHFPPGNIIQQPHPNYAVNHQFHRISSHPQNVNFPVNYFNQGLPYFMYYPFNM